MCAEDIKTSGLATEPTATQDTRPKIVQPSDQDIDKDKIRRSIRLFLEGIGENPDREGLKNTPDRVARMWEEFRQRQAFSMAFFSNGESYDQLILCKDIPLVSICEHHILPYIGKAHVAYIPNQYLLGLSKLARIVDHFSLGLSIQEDLTCKIADYIWKKTSPQGVAVIIEAEHLCMTLRGVRKPGAITKTSKLLGAFFNDLNARQELMHLIG